MNRIFVLVPSQPHWPAVCWLVLSLGTIRPALAQEWSHTWGGTKSDSLSSVASDSKGNIYVTGSTSSFGAGGQDVLLLKYDSTGRLLWSSVWGGPGDEGGNGVAVDGSGNVYVAGATQSFGAGWSDALLLKFDSSGNLLWSRTWGGPSFDAGYAIAFDINGNVYVAAESYSLGNRAVLLKFDPNGSLLSSHTWKGPTTYDSAYSVDVDGSGNVVLAGISWDYSVSPNHNSILILKFDAQGNFLWNRKLVSGAEDEVSGKIARFDPNGNILLSGHRATVCNNPDFSQCNFDVEIAKLDPDGNLSWAKSWGGSGYESVAGLAFDQSGNLIVTGSTQSFQGGTSAVMALRFDSAGNLLRSRIWSPGSVANGSGTAVDNSGLIIIAGSAPNASGNWQDVTGSSGSLSPSLTAPSGNVGSSTGGIGFPSGSVGAATGIIDSGGGGVDALVLRTSLAASTPVGPSVTAGGVLNAASNVGGPIAPGSIAIAKGNFLLNSPTAATTQSWPASLGGLSMQLGGVPAPLYYVSGAQVNLQVPWELAGKSQAAIAATAGGQTSIAQAVDLAPFAPGIFSLNSQGTGQGAIVDNASGQVVDGSHPATPGVTFLQIYCTGLGAVTNQPATGSPAPSSPLAKTTTTPIVMIGGIAASVIFSGLAPGSVGEYVVDVQTPAAVPAGNAVPVVISIGGIVSNTVTIAVKSASAGTLTSINPSSSAAGKILTVVIAGTNTNFVQGQTLASFGPGIGVGESPLGQAGIVTVISPTSATAQVAIDPSAALGARTVTVTTGTQTASLNNAFAVLTPPPPLGPLSITSTLPANGAVNVSMTPSIQITFNEPLDPATIGPSTFTLANTRTALPATITTDSTGAVVTLIPSGVLTPNATYTLTINAQVRNAAESPLGSPFTFSFTIVPPVTVAGTVSVPSGLDPTILRVLSFGGNVTTPDSSGSFYASLNPSGTSLVAAMLPGKAFGFLAVATTGTSATSTATVLSSVQSTITARPVHKTRWQVTASAAAASSQNSLVTDFQTTAEALVFMSPYVFTADPQRASAVLIAIAASPSTAQLAQALTQSWTEPDPLGDSAVQSAGESAVLAVLQRLAAQTPMSDQSLNKAGFHSPEAAEAPRTSGNPTVQVTPYCWPDLSPRSGATSALPCLDLKLISIPADSISVKVNGDYGFDPINCTGQLGGCSVGWLARIMPLPSGRDPGSITTTKDSFGPASPSGNDLATCNVQSSCVTAWIPGSSAFRFLDLGQAISGGASAALPGISQLFSTGPSFVLPSTAQHQQAYIARFYSGGIADSDELRHVQNSDYGESTTYYTDALEINLLEEAIDFLSAATVGISDSFQSELTCALTATVDSFGTGTIVAGNLVTFDALSGEFESILKEFAGQAVSCVEDQGLGSLLEVAGKVLWSGSPVGAFVNALSATGSLSQAGQRLYDIAYRASAVETAVISISPGSLVENPIPSITSLSPASGTAGDASLPLAISGKYLLSNSVVTFNRTPHPASLTMAGNLTISLNTADLATPGVFPVVVTNPAPGGGMSNSISFTVEAPVSTSTLQSMTLNPSSVVGGSSVAGTVTLSAPAPTGGVQVALSSSNPSAQVPASVTIASGQSSATFTVTTTTVTATQTATITASLGTSTATAVLRISPGTSAPVITEYPVPTSASLPSGIVTGPDGALWFTEFHANKIGRITTAGVITEYPVSAYPVGIAAGPDGALWFAEFGGKIGRITTSGVITEYSVPTPSSGPNGIAAGPDGAIWFTEASANQTINAIGRITTAGVITEYPVPTPNSAPEWITAGPDGALWFTELNGNKIGRISTDGAITEYPVPTTTQLSGIAAGPDGALWFAENIDKIGRITTAGVVTEYPAPAGVAAGPGITVGPDGALWFGGTGRITTAGIASAYPGPATSSLPYAITAGPDGALWFTEYYGNQIGRVGLDPSSIVTPALQGLWLSSTAVTGGGSFTGTAILTGPAPPGGAQVILSSNNSSVQVPASVIVASGQTSATFTITAASVTSPQTVLITATLGKIQQTANLTVTPASTFQWGTFLIYGTTTIDGQTVKIEIALGQAITYTAGVDSGIDLTSPIVLLLLFDQQVSLNGHTATFTGVDSASSYTNVSTGVLLQPVTSGTLTVTLNSSAIGSSVSGQLQFSAGGTTRQSSFTGTIVSN